MIRVLRSWWIPIGILLLGLLTFIIWAEIIPAPMSEALTALKSTSQVKVETYPWLIFRPVNTQSSVGFILYPGGRIDPRSYAPAAAAIAARGILVVITPMPLHLAVLAPGKAGQVIKAFPQINIWAVGGHSLGGSMAANFVKQNPEAVRGLVLWASYPASTDHLTGSDLQVLSIYGTRDGLATLDKIESSGLNLPGNTLWYPIEGGNHAQFGWYGTQAGDLPATISRQSQQSQVEEVTANFLLDLTKK